MILNYSVLDLWREPSTCFSVLLASHNCITTCCHALPNTSDDAKARSLSFRLQEGRMLELWRSLSRIIVNRIGRATTSRGVVRALCTSWLLAAVGVYYETVSADRDVQGSQMLLKTTDMSSQPHVTVRRRHLQIWGITHSVPADTSLGFRICRGPKKLDGFQLCAAAGWEFCRDWPRWSSGQFLKNS